MGVTWSAEQSKTESRRAGQEAGTAHAEHSAGAKEQENTRTGGQCETKGKTRHWERIKDQTHKATEAVDAK